MPPKKKEIEDHLESIELLLAGILLDRKPDIKQVARIMKCNDKKISKNYPERKVKKHGRKKK